MKTYLTTFVCMLSLACYSQQARFSFRPARTWIEAGDMWAGQFSTSGEFQISESRFYLGFNVEGIYGVRPNGVTQSGRETVVTSGGTSPYYDPTNPIWDDGMLQFDSSPTKQMAIGVGPRISFYPLRSSRHSVGLALDFLVRYNDQTFIQFEETIRTDQGDFLDVAVPVYWSFLDWASAISLEYTYSITEHCALGAFGQFRASSEYYQYGSYGLVTTWMF
ncbi:hypothetical protein [Phaeocystidibacter luteus]|uniref:Uncharacterized protein n=1 Tax=Phaeocystidibacter luteus TaxID=911197 RepID=A0A6N6RKV7_9FLAO|nr:hypothetical protein [Phaeocystidibacter luteus]KAB2809888.1 hypothetical protein F8C67_08380 [Phaeocystidibacter luteus]